jgi:hypothetical protein
MALYELTSGKDFVKLGDRVFSKYEEVPRNPFQFEEWIHDNTPHVYEHGTRDTIELRGINKKLCELFGSKITLRLNAALYNTFIKANFPVETYFAINRQGKHWRTFSPVVVNHAITNKHLIDQAVKDRTINLIPLMLQYEEDTQQLRKRFGKGLWKQLSHTSKTRMRYLAPMLKRNVDYVSVRTGILKQTGLWENFTYRNSPDFDSARLTAAKVAPRVIDFERTESMIKDTLRMAQRNRSEVNYDWSYRRWHEEHEFLSREINKSKFSEKKFAEDCVFTQGGYTFTLLTSELDIATEGNTMKHCVSSYARKASKGHYAVFKVEGKERATLGLNLYATGGAIDQCYGYCNQSISDDLRSVLPRIVRMYDDTLRLRDGRTASGSDQGTRPVVDDGGWDGQLYF